MRQQPERYVWRAALGLVCGQLRAVLPCKKLRRANDPTQTRLARYASCYRSVRSIPPRSRSLPRLPGQVTQTAGKKNELGVVRDPSSRVPLIGSLIHASLTAPRSVPPETGLRVPAVVATAGQKGS